MKSNFKWVLIGTVIIVAGCSSNNIKQSGLVYFNDFESIKGWGGDMSRLTDYKAHSGHYSSFVDSINPYSYTFKLLFKDISPDKIKGVNYSVWCYADAIPVKGTIVVSAGTNSGSPIFWNGNNLDNYITEAGQWVKIKAHVDIDPKAVTPGNEFGFYLTNSSKAAVFADDFTLEFTK